MSLKKLNKTGDGSAISLRLPADLLEKVKFIAEKNHLSVSDVLKLSISAGTLMVETKLGEINEPKAA